MEFKQISDEKISKLVSYRINSLRQKTLLLKSRLNELTDILWSNNPALAETIEKVVDGISLPNQTNNLMDC